MLPPFQPLLSRQKKTKKKKKKPSLMGPVKNSQGIPYDYIVVIDAGSSGSRAYIYNWLNAEFTHEAKLDVNLVKGMEEADDDDIQKRENLDEGDKNNNSSSSEDEDDNEQEKDVIGDMGNIEGTKRLPQVRTKPKWHRKIKPGISSFNKNPGKIGKDHIKILLDRVGKIIPVGQHERTPIFLHATAGMRLLKPQEQESLMSNICKYIQKNYDYYLPDCSSHINIIDGDVEGLYGWIGLNYLMGSLDQPLLHDHGKNHSTYGLLDMGGASTQISFQPNSTEEAEHANALFKVQLSSLGTYEPDLNYNVFSTSFLGFGINKLHENYLKRLRNSTMTMGNLENVLTDPCLPKGLTTKIDGFKDVGAGADDILGVGNFTQCMDLIYPLLVESENSDAASCSNVNPQDISSCLLTNSIPSLDFDVDKFVGVSGYWDAVSNMLGIDNISQYGNAYDYQSFYLETEKICQTRWEELDHYNDDDIKTMFGVLTDSELTELCFKSSWILNVLHRGLGFPKIELEDSNANIKPFQVAESINGSEFSWTLGRAILYATWENAKFYSQLEKNRQQQDVDIKIGYYHASSPNLFIYGGEKRGIDPRPKWTKYSGNDKSSSSNSSTNKDKHKGDDHDHDWELEDVHKSYSSLIIFILLLVVIYFILGPKKRHLIYKKLKKISINVSRKLKIPSVSNSRYLRLAGDGNDLELNELGSGDENNNNNNNNINNNFVNLENEIDDHFLISDDEDEEEDDIHLE